jgi:hypothetical protein
LAQQQGGTTLRQQLVGAWEYTTQGSPQVAQVLGTDPKGYLILNGSGRYNLAVENRNRPKTGSPTADGFAAQFGSWSVNEGDKTLTLHREGALDSRNEGTDVKTTISINGDEMRATNNETKTTNVYRRPQAQQPQPQQGTLRQQILGTWEAVSNTYPPTVPIVGNTPKGQFIFGGRGVFTLVLKNPNRSKDVGRSADGFLGAFGTWSVNETDKTQTIHIDGSTSPSAEGIDLTATVSINGDEMRRTNSETKSTSVYRRVRAQ